MAEFQNFWAYSPKEKCMSTLNPQFSSSDRLSHSFILAYLHGKTITNDPEIQIMFDEIYSKFNELYSKLNKDIINIEEQPKIYEEYYKARAGLELFIGILGKSEKKPD
jgi:hypothetical protein